jgi:hypothetical protein
MLVEHPLNVGNLGVEFEIRKGGKLLGKLQISQTSIDWTPAKARNPRKAGWQEFADWMESKGARRNCAAGRVSAAASADDEAAPAEAIAEVVVPVADDEPDPGERLGRPRLSLLCLLSRSEGVP